MSNPAFIRRVVSDAGYRVENIERRATKPACWGWLKVSKPDTLVISGRTYRTETEAYAACHKVNNLRSA